MCDVKQGAAPNSVSMSISVSTAIHPHGYCYDTAVNQPVIVKHECQSADATSVPCIKKCYASLL